MTLNHCNALPFYYWLILKTNNSSIMLFDGPWEAFLADTNKVKSGLKLYLVEKFQGDIEINE